MSPDWALHIQQWFAALGVQAHTGQRSVVRRKAVAAMPVHSRHWLLRSLLRAAFLQGRMFQGILMYKGAIPLRL